MDEYYERKFSSSLNKFKLSRRGNKLSNDDQGILPFLPKDISERTWVEILQNEETCLMILDVREEIFEDAMNVCYMKYLDKQKVSFTAHCAAQAWLKLINWNFFRHDPGEDPTAYPPCYIPKRKESWIPDEPPKPSPKDTWCAQELDVIDYAPEAVVTKWPSSSSIDMPIIEDIPKEYWFPGKVELAIEKSEDMTTHSLAEEPIRTRSELKVGADSEILQRVTDYSAVDVTDKVSKGSETKAETPVPQLEGAGDSSVEFRPERKHIERSKLSNKSFHSRSKASLANIQTSKSHISIISDCRLRSHRVEIQHEISSEIIETPPGDTKRK